MKTTEAAKDAFFDARANLRDTVKWLAATFAALAAVVIGSAPLSGLGALEIPSAQFGCAVAALLIGFVCICWALYLTLHILRPVLVSRSDLLVEPGITESTEEAREFGRVRAVINAKARDLLPRNYQDLAALSRTSKEVDAQLKRLPATPVTELDKSVRATGLDLRKSIDDTVIELLPLALYLTLQQRLARSICPLFILGIAALVSLAFYGIAVHSDPPKPAGTPALVFNNMRPADRAREAALPVLEPVLFDPGKAVVSTAGITAVQRARDAMRERPDTVLLLLAHTDTVGGTRINASLSRRRAQAVLALLKGTGGVSESRIYVAELPKLDTPEVTRPGQASPSNRSVQLRLVVLKKAG